MKKQEKKIPSFHCSLCGADHQGFLSGAKGRNQRLCPACGAKGRQRTAWLALLGVLAGLGNNPRILHCAPERAFEPKLRAMPGNRYLTCDLEVPGVDLRLDLTRCPIRDACLDLVICNHVLEHVHEDARALAEMARVLAPGGVLFLTVPVHRGEKTVYHPDEQGRPLEDFGPQEHVRYYGWDLADACRRTGLDTTVENKAADLTPEERSRLGLKNEFVFLGRKPA